MTNKIDISPEAVERLAKDHDEVADRHDELIMGHPHHCKTATTLRALSARLAEVMEERNTQRDLCLAAEAVADEFRAKLAKAVQALLVYADTSDCSDYEKCGWEGNLCCKTASAALAEINVAETRGEGHE